MNKLNPLIKQMAAIIQEAYALGGEDKIAELFKNARGRKTRPYTKQDYKKSGRIWREGSNTDHILKIIKVSPGLTSAQIRKAYQKKHGPIKDSTFYAALNKLKTNWNRPISLKEGKYYPK